MSRENPVSPRQSNDSTGSPVTGEPVFLAVGQFRRTHGIKGEIVFEVITDFPERLKRNKVIYVGESHEPMRIIAARNHGRNLLLTIEGYDTVEKVAELRNRMVFSRVDELPRLPKGQYYHHELLGLTVQTSDGALLGKLTDILETRANDVYVITAEDGSETLLPVIEDVILEVDTDKKVMVVNPPEWG